MRKRTWLTGIVLIAVLVAVGLTARWAIDTAGIRRDMADPLQVVGRGDTDRLQMLLERGLDINGRYFFEELPDDHATLLTTAVLSENLAMIRFLVDAGADVDQKNGSDKTPLCCAAVFQNLDVIELLLDRGADPNVVCGSATALMIAAGRGRADIVEHLLANGADPSLQSENGRTAIHSGAYGHISLDLMNRFLELGADPAAVSDSGETALHCATYGDTTRDGPALEQIAEFLIAHGTPVNQADNRGLTALHWAAERSAKVVRLLIEAGADPHAVDNDGWSALHHAARYGSAESVRLLLDAGVDPTATVSDPSIGTGLNVVDLAHGRLGRMVPHPEDSQIKIHLLEEALAAAEKPAGDEEGQ
jgi:ankyrin repeat protein